MTQQNEMKLRTIAVWGFLLAGVLGLIAGLRDIFAPGFFNISPRIPSKTDIVLQFALAGTFLALAVLANINKNQAFSNKK